MDNFEFSLKTHIIFGADVENNVGQTIKNSGGRRVLLHYGKNVANRTGVLERVRRSLDREGLDYFELGGVVVNARASMVYEGIELCRAHNLDYILALGGCSVIDSAKAIGAGMYYDGDFWDIFKEQKHVYRALPLGVILTMPAAGSECSEHTVITNEENGQRGKLHIASEALVPEFVMFNPNLTRSLSLQETAYVCSDMIAHVLSRYFSKSQDNPLTDLFCESIIKVILDNLPRIKNNPDNFEVRSNLMWAGTIAHSELYGAGRVQDWSTHIIERAISTIYDNIHGAGLAVLTPAYLNHVKLHNVMRMAQFAHRVFNVPFNFEKPLITVEEGIERLRLFYRNCGLPLNLHDLGVDSAMIPSILDLIDFKGQKTIGNYVPLTKLDCEGILSAMASYRYN